MYQVNFSWNEFVDWANNLPDNYLNKDRSSTCATCPLAEYLKSKYDFVKYVDGWAHWYGISMKYEPRMSERYLGQKAERFIMRFDRMINGAYNDYRKSDILAAIGVVETE